MQPWGTPAKTGLHDEVKNNRLKQPFEICLIDTFQEGYKALQKYSQT